MDSAPESFHSAEVDMTDMYRGMGDQSTVHGVGGITNYLVFLRELSHFVWFTLITNMVASIERTKMETPLAPLFKYDLQYCPW